MLGKVPDRSSDELPSEQHSIRQSHHCELREMQVEKERYSDQKGTWLVCVCE